VQQDNPQGPFTAPLTTYTLSDIGQTHTVTKRSIIVELEVSGTGGDSRRHVEHVNKIVHLLESAIQATLLALKDSETLPESKQDTLRAALWVDAPARIPEGANGPELVTCKVCGTRNAALHGTKCSICGGLL
jgi:hypothetical protein